jgi:hypothetical protein
MRNSTFLQGEQQVLLFLGGLFAPLRASFLQNKLVSAKFCAVFRLNGEPPHKMRSLAYFEGDLSLPPLATVRFRTKV